MKVLQINAVYGVGSTGTIIADIHELCMKSGLESYVAYSTSPLSGSEIANSYQIGRNAGKKMHALLCRINGKQAYFSRLATRRFLRYLDDIRPDLIVLHNLHSNFIHLNMLLAYIAQHSIKTVLVLHDCWFYTGGCFHYTEAGCGKWRERCGGCPKKTMDTPAYLFDRSTKILADRRKYFSRIADLTVVGVSEWITNEAAKSFLGRRKLLTIHNGVDLDVFCPSGSDFRRKYGAESKFVILGPASKWLDPINAEALCYFREHLDTSMLFALLGCTDKQLKQLPHGVIGLPYAHDRTELARIYSASDVFVNCSHEESLCLINLETQACGTPVVTYDNTGLGETVSEAGMKVRTNDYKELFRAVMYIKAVEKPEELSNRCREHISGAFEKQMNYQKYIDLFRALTGESDEG